MHGEIIYTKVDLVMLGGRTKAALLANIAKIDAVIDQLQTTALKSVTTGDKALYELDDGQSKIRVEYTDLTMVSNAVEKYEIIRQYYVNKLTPRMVRLVDQRNFNRRNIR